VTARETTATPPAALPQRTAPTIRIRSVCRLAAPVAAARFLYCHPI